MRRRWRLWLLVLWPLAASSETTPLPGSDQQLLESMCITCHGTELVAQQRLTEDQWRHTLAKMQHWGSRLPADATHDLAEALARSFGERAGPFDAPRVSSEEAARALAPTPDGVFADGSVARGRELYVARCAACHGPDAEGLIGVNLVDRPFLDRAQAFAETLRSGRALMPPMPDLDDSAIADLLAFLRTLP